MRRLAVAIRISRRGAASEGLEFEANGRRCIRSAGRQLPVEHPAAIDDAREAIREDRQHRPNPGKQKRRRDGELDGVGDGGDAGVLLHAPAEAKVVSGAAPPIGGVRRPPRPAPPGVPPPPAPGPNTPAPRTPGLWTA